MHKLRLTLLIIFCTAVVFPGCAHWQVNQQLVDFTPEKDFQYQMKSSPLRSPNLGVIVAFSGGGTRAAALAFGVLETMESVPFPHAEEKNHTLLDEVDLISSVSGASFVSAYYALHGKQALKDFPDRFLYKKVTRALLGKVLMPWNWFLMASPYFSRTDLAIEYYDKILFDKKRLGDFIAPTQIPAISIQATDMVEGIPFSLTPPSFYAICSDWRTFSVARAVTASSAFPGAFEPVPIKNYAGTCGYDVKSKIASLTQQDHSRFEEFSVARRLNLYQDSEKKKYIHLLDGGISDNLGIRGPMDQLRLYHNRFEDNNYPSEILIVVVNAQTKLSNQWDVLSKIPGIGEVIGAASSAMIGNFNQDTLVLLDLAFSSMQKRAEDSKGKFKPFRYSIVEVSFDAIKDPAQKEYFNTMPTSLSLPKKSVDDLRHVAKELMLQSEPFRAFAKRNNITLPQ